ncbi:hypothetical protein Tco_0866450, partial [Tanacetum coccineum]
MREYDWAILRDDSLPRQKHYGCSVVPWYIAKTERELKEQLKLMDVVIEVRDARIPIVTSHRREDMISYADRNAWADYYKKLGIKVVFSNGKLGM